MSKDLSHYKKALQQEWEAEQLAGPDAAKFLTSKAHSAARTIADLAENAPDPRVRLQASMFILNNTTFATQSPNELGTLMDKLAPTPNDATPQ